MKKLLSLSFILLLLMGCAIDNVGNDEEIISLPTPRTVDDSFVILKNAKLIISLDEILKNDEVQLKMMNVSFDTETLSHGKIVKNENGDYVYIPEENFVGIDTFTYTVCNDKTDNYCSSATITIKIKEIVKPNPEDPNQGEGGETNPDDDTNYFNFHIPNELKTYYSSLKSVKNAEELRQKMKQIVDNYRFVCYDAGRHQYLMKADEDKNNNNNVVLIYSGESRTKEDKNIYFNTEHVFPKSLLREALINIGVKVPKKGTSYCKDNIYNRTIGDLHHLRYCKSNINSSRSNRPFTDGSGSYKIVNHKYWYPGDEWKGDVARMIFYINLKYGCPFEIEGDKESSIGPKELFLKWNREDPVSDLEKQRNNEIQKAQGNRNPFIDNPYLATKIYGGEPAENTWK